MTDFIAEQRTDVFDNRNSAQQEFADFLENTENKQTEHLVLDSSLYGDLDLDILYKSGFHKVSVLEFIEGQITSIKNLPKSVKSLVCANNLLIDLPMPSDHLETLDLKSNFLTTADLKPFPQLKKINLSFNRLTELENVPSKTRELYCSDNQIRRIDLGAADQIHILYCSNNPHLLIEHVPPSLKDFQMENTQFLEIYKNLGNVKIDQKHVKEHNQKIDFIEALQIYFKLKRKYEDKSRDLKKTEYRKLLDKNTPKKKIQRLLADVKIPCVNCRQPNGTLFELKSDPEDKRVYSAICGNRKKPCNLNIQLSTGQYQNVWESIDLTRDFLQEYKEKIIKHKLDVLFNYISEDNAASRFKTDLEEYYATKELHEHAVQRYEMLYHNPETREKIRDKSNTLFDKLEQMDKLIQEYKDTGLRSGATSAILKDAMNVYFREIRDLSNEIYGLKYAMSEMYYQEHKDMYILKQWTANLTSLDYSYGDVPEVVKFVRL
jgi:hypothetical protein